MDATVPREPTARHAVEVGQLTPFNAVANWVGTADAPFVLSTLAADQCANPSRVSTTVPLSPAATHALSCGQSSARRLRLEARLQKGFMRVGLRGGQLTAPSASSVPALSTVQLGFPAKGRPRTIAPPWPTATHVTLGSGPPAGQLTASTRCDVAGY